MEQIISNLETPAWWFTGLFFAFLSVFLTKLVFSWTPLIWKKISKLFPEYLQGLVRKREKKSLQIIKNHRQHSVRVQWLISRYWALATISCIYAVFVGIMFAVSSWSNEGLEKFTPLILFVPYYVLSYFVIRDKKLLKRIIKEHLAWKKRITRRYDH